MAMKPRLLIPSFLAIGLLTGGPAWPQADPLTDPLPRTLGEAADRRIDRLEQTVREMRAILFQGRETGRPVVVQPAETQGQLDILRRDVDDLQETLRRMNDQIDSLSADITALRRDLAQDAAASRAQASANASLLGRVEAIERELAARAAAQRAVDEDPETAFNNAMQLYVDGENLAAIAPFRAFLDRHPESEGAPEARFYLGEALSRDESYTEAAQAYLASIRGFPETPWAPEAMVKLAVALIETGRNPDACGVLEELSSRYPRAAQPIRAQATDARRRARCG